MSVISAGNTINTAYVVTGDTTGNLVVTTGGSNTTALTISNAQIATFASNVSVGGTVILSSSGIKFSDGSTQTGAASSIAPNVTIYTSGSGTYTTPAGAKYLIVEMVGAGGGGGGGGTSGATGSTGGSTTFGSNTCNGGVGGWGKGNETTTGPLGGSTTLGTGTLIWAANGGRGGAGVAITNTINQWNFSVPSGMGGGTPFGPGGSTVQYQGGGLTPAANSGGGGSGGGPGYGTAAAYSGAGGGGGGYIKCLINSPSSTYSYAVGSGGSGGSGDYSTGGTGAAGQIIVLAYF